MRKRNWLRRLLGGVRDIAVSLVDGAVVLGVSRKTSCIAIIRVDGIGDFILWFGYIQRLREHFQGAPMVLICSRAVEELATSCGYFEAVMPIDGKAFTSRPFYRWTLIRSVRALNAAIAVQPTFSRNYLIGDALIRATGASKTIGSQGDLANMTRWQRWIADRWYSDLVPADERPLTELERNCEFMRGLGLEDVMPAIAELPRIAELTESLSIRGDYFIVFPGAAHAEKMWPIEKFVATARAVRDCHGWRVVICGTEAERERAEAITDGVGAADSINFAGTTSLGELIELVRAARLLIGNDTSAQHIAAAVGTPSVCLLGGGHFGRFLPYPAKVAGTRPVCVFERMECFGCNWRCIKPHEKGSAVPCIGAINVAATLEAVQRALAEEESTFDSEI